MDVFNFKESKKSKDYVGSVTLVITGADLDPEIVTEALGVSANQSWKQGEKKVFRTGREHVCSWGGWKLFQKENTMSLPLEDQLEAWCVMLEDRSPQLRELKDIGYSSILDCYLSSSEAATVQLGASLFEKFIKLGIGIEFNFFPSQPD